MAQKLPGLSDYLGAKQAKFSKMLAQSSDRSRNELTSTNKTGSVSASHQKLLEDLKIIMFRAKTD